MVLATARVANSILLIQLMSICLAALIALVGMKLMTSHKLETHKLETVVFVFIALTLLALGIPLAGTSSEPERWIELGLFKLYIAPVFLPSLLVVCSVALQKSRKEEVIALVGLGGAACLLAAQPDGPQVLALSVGASVILLRRKPNAIQIGLSLLVMTITSVWAFMQPDPLQPVAYVEGVFELAFNQSMLLGVVVIFAAVVLVVGLCWESQKGQPWLWAVAAYYLILYLFSLAGLTPAPLIGFGSGPILGFGLMVLLSSLFKEKIT
ncbi:MAG: hypothetical protein ACRC62_08415 [Microcoleus sp.]